MNRNMYAVLLAFMHLPVLLSASSTHHGLSFIGGNRVVNGVGVTEDDEITNFSERYSVASTSKTSSYVASSSSLSTDIASSSDALTHVFPAYIDSASKDSLVGSQNYFFQVDSIWHGKNKKLKAPTYPDKKKEIKLNNEAVKLIQFDFTPGSSDSHQMQELAPMDKPWMDFQVDLSVPTNMIDTTKVRKPQNYIRLLPYSIWTRYGDDFVYDVYMFGKKKNLEIAWQMKIDLDEFVEYGRSMAPLAGSYNPNVTTNASVVIGNLDFIGFLYNNLNKQGRIRKHNRKHANAWKTYQKAAPYLADASVALNDSIRQSDTEDSQAYPGLYHNLKSIALIEEKSPKYFERPDHRLLQTPEQRSRFGSFYDPELYALPSDFEHSEDVEKKDSLALDSIRTDSIPTDSMRGNWLRDNAKKDKQEFKKTKLSRKEQKELEQLRAQRAKKRKKEQQMEKERMKELPNRMEDFYKYMRTKQEQDSIQREEKKRADKVGQNVYELEQQQRKLKEQQN